jgi:hypothetical protein
MVGSETIEIGASEKIPISMSLTVSRTRQTKRKDFINGVL